MKGKEIPQTAIYGGLAVVLLLILGVAYAMFMKPAPQIDPNKLTPQQMQDPDPPRPAR